MPKTKPPKSVVINVARKRNPNLHDGLYECVADLVVEMRPADLEKPWPESLKGTFESVRLSAHRGTAAQLQHLLDQMLPRLKPDATMDIEGFEIRGDQFQRLLRECDSLMLSNCRFGRGWWLPVQGARCDSISFWGCTGVTRPASPTTPTAPVTSITLSTTSMWDTHIKRTPHSFVTQLVTSFASENLESLCLSWLASSDFVAELPDCPKLTDLMVDRLTPESFAWIVRQKRLGRLAISWDKGVTLPLQDLSRLRRLRSLSVEGSACDDDDLLTIRAHTRLRHVSAYYSKLTACSWPTILDWPGLRSFWGSQELASDEPILGLPAESSLREFVGLNVRIKWFQKFLARYPNIEVVEM